MIDFELKLPAEKKDEFGYTPSENRVIEKQLTRPSPPKGTWKRFVKANQEADKLIAAKAAEEAKEKKHLKEMILFGLENSSEPVIKNPVMRKALESKPRRQENAMERINRIKYEFGETKEKPKHLDNKNIYSFEDQFDKNFKNIKDYKPTAKKPFKTVPKVKAGKPVKIDFNLDTMHTAGLWSNIKNSSLYKLLDHPHPMGVELGYEGIMEAYNLLQNSGLLKKGGRVK